MTTSVAFFCPKCGSPSVDTSSLVGGEASCRICDWHGTNTAMDGHVFKHERGSQEEIATAFLLEIKSLVGGVFAVPIGRLLVKWGFLTTPVTAEEVSRYLTAVARNVAKTLLEERQAIEVERIQNGN